MSDGPAPAAAEEPADGGEELAGEGAPGVSTTTLGWLELFYGRRIGSRTVGGAAGPA